MKRRNFLARIFGGAVVVAVTPVVVKAAEIPVRPAFTFLGLPVVDRTTGDIYRFINGRWVRITGSPTGPMLKMVDGVPHWLETSAGR